MRLAERTVLGVPEPCFTVVVERTDEFTRPLVGMVVAGRVHWMSEHQVTDLVDALTECLTAARSAAAPQS